MTTSNPYDLQQDVRFCTTSDGARIAFATMGGGPPLVKAANWLSHLEFDRRSPCWMHWLRELSRGHRFVRYDERGCGLSDWEVEFSFDAWVSDLEAVVDAAGLDRFPLLGVSQGGSVAIEYAVRHPERVSHLILYGAYAVGWKHRENPVDLEQRRALITLMKAGWGNDNPAYRQIFSSLFLPEGTPEQFDWFNELQRASTSPENAIRFQETFGEINVQDRMSQVTVPTLVLHARHDARIPFDMGRDLAAGIPGSRFVALDSKNHLILEHEPAWEHFIREVRGFLGLEGGPLSLPGVRSHAAFGSQLPGFPAPDSKPRARVSSPKEPVDALSTLRHALSDRYDLEHELGRGGMATVYHARERKHARAVAIKVIHPELTVGEGADRFHREIQITSQLQHPHIVPLLDSGSAGRLLYYVTPFIKGASLRDHLRRGDPMSVDRVTQLTQDISAALDHAHRQGVIHRDIKPGNIMIGDGQAIVTDFGIAKAVQEPRDHQLTATGAIIGTMDYMSPEQLTGSDPVDARSDVFSLGCVVYEMLAGSPPFSRAGSSSALLREPAPSLRGQRPEVPAHVEAAVAKAMASEPAQRFETAGLFAQALTLSAQSALSSGRPFRWVLIGALVAAGIAAAAVWLL